MSFHLNHLPREVAGPLRAYHRRQQILRVLRVVLSTGIVYGLLLLVAVHVDRFWFLDLETRVHLGRLVHALAAGFALVSLAVHWWRRPSVEQIAYEVQERLPNAGHERLVTLHDVLRHGGEPQDEICRQLQRDLQEATVAMSREIRGGKLVRDRRLRWVCGGAILLAALIGGLFLPAGYEFPLMLQRFYQPRANLAKPSFVKLRIINQQEMIGKGEEVVVQAELAQDVPGWAKWMLKRLGMPANQCLIGFRDGAHTTLDLTQLEPELMSRVDRRLFLYSRGNVQKTLSFKVRCGDAETRVHTVRVIPQPRVLDLKLVVTQPEYVGLPVREITDFSKPLRFLKGSRITVSFATDQDVPKRRIYFARQREPVDPERDEESGRFTHQFDLTRKTAFEVIVENQEGFRNVERSRINIGIYNDARPSVRLVEPAGNDLRLVPAEIVPLAVELEDDLGLEELVIVYLVNPDPNAAAAAQEIPVSLPEGAKTKAAMTAVFDMEKLSVSPGDVVHVHLRAKDSAGNYGESRQLTIDIVAFTRGENERRRLARLRFIQQALALTAAAPAPKKGTGDTMALAANLARKISGLADNVDVKTNGDSIRSILQFIETELHFTDDPVHKRDLRQIYAVLYAAGRNFDPAADHPYAYRARLLKTLADSILPDLIRYRRLKNMIWRYYGLRYEAVNIIAKIKKMTAEKATRDQKTSLIKRATLYLKSLEDLGEELSIMSRETELLDLKVIQDQLAEMNTRGYMMKRRRGSLGSRSRSAEEVIDQINTMLKDFQPKLVPLAAKEAQARRELQRQYDQILMLLADPKVAAAGRRRRAADWIDADMRLMQWNPFADFWPLFRNFALSTMLRRDYDAAKARALIAPDKAVRTRIAAARAMNRRLADDYQAASVLALPGLAVVEQVLAANLIMLEDAHARQASTGAYVARIKSLNPRVNPDFDPAAFRTERRQWWSTQQVDQTKAALIAAARQRYIFQPVAEVLTARRKTMQEHGRRMRELLQAEETEPDAMQELAAEVIPPALEHLRPLDDLCVRLMLELQDPRLPPAEREKLDVLLLNMRNQRERIRSRFMIQFRDARHIKADGSVEVSTVEAFKTDLEQFLNTYLLAAAQLNGLREGFEGTREEPKRKRTFAAIADLKRIHRYAQAFRAVIDGADPKAKAVEFIETFPNIALVYLYANRGFLETAYAKLQQAETVLAAEDADRNRYNSILEQAEAGLNRFQQIVQRAGEGDIQDRLVLALGTTLTRLSQLRASADADAARISKIRFDLNTVIRRLDRSRSDVQDLADLEEQVKGFKGGPPLIDPAKRDLDTAEERMLQQVRHARRRQILAILAGLESTIPPGTAENGLAWAMWEQRLTRSDINGIRIDQGGGGGGGTGTVSLKKWLEAENEKAKESIHSLQNYKDAQKEYHNIAGDLLQL